MKRYFGLIAVLIIVLIGSFIAGKLLTPEERLKIFNPTDVNPILVDDSLKKVSKFHRVSGFKLLDQEGNLTDDSWVEEQIYVVDFFFTTCQTICPLMTSQMQRASKILKEKPVKFISFSVTPELDSVPVLKAYANQSGIDYSQWRLLTGEKEDIYRLARKSFFALKPAEAGMGDGGVSDFIHTNNFVLVDREKRIRGYYDGTSVEDIDRLIREVDILLNEQK